MRQRTFFSFVLIFFLSLSPLRAEDHLNDQSVIAGQFGTLPQPQDVSYVLSAGNPADVLLLALVPEKLLGFAGFDMAAPKAALFTEPLNKLPKLGRLAGRGSTLSLESIVKMNPSLIVDAGSVDESYLSNAARVSKQTGVAYVLLDGKLKDTPKQLREFGALIGVEQRAETLAIYAENMLQRAADYRQKHPNGMSFYYGRSADGLETGFHGSMHSEAVEFLGLTNVAQAEGFNGIARVSMEQILTWNPQIILTQDENFYRSVRRLPVWQGIDAVKNNRVYFVPYQPFGWLDVPPSLNRLLGLRWLEAQIDPTAANGLEQDVMAFFKLYYHITLTEEQVKKLLVQP
jgi:iron complex transport system substrate-binding protein